MIPVVFVLGAGASEPYGFPTGEALKGRIWRTLISATETGFSNQERAAIVSALRAAGFKRAEMFSFAEKLRDSRRLSIDAFLEWKPEFAGIGKAAIVCELLPFEAQTPFAGVERDWYRYLYNRLFQRPEDVGRVKTAFITFNYDRSFDEFLIRALGTDADMSRDEVLAAIPVKHPYGTLGTEEYGAPLTGRDIKADAEAIRVMGEPGVIEKEAFSETRQLIMEAETICCLGFGYHEDNISRLQISNEYSKESLGGLMNHGEHRPVPQKTVIGTTVGLSDADLQRITRYFNVHADFGYGPRSAPDLQRRDVDVLTFLENTDVLDQARRQTAEA